MTKGKYIRIPKHSPEKILEWRSKLKNGMKQKDLAKEINLSAARLSNILSADCRRV